jgi:tetratricopeptide (TPR) repeat protein
MSGNDQFADLLAAFSKPKDDAKLTLAERQRLASNSPLNSFNNNTGRSTTNQWADLDLLSRTSSVKSSTQATGKNTPDSNNLFEGFDVVNRTNAGGISNGQVFNTNSSNEDDLFEGFLSKSSTTFSQQQQQNLAGEMDLLGDTTYPVPDNSTQNASQDLDDLFAVFDKPPKPEPPLVNPKPVNIVDSSILLNSDVSSRPRKATPPVNDESRDEAISAIVDMGFDIDQANDALNHTSTGVDVQQAISYIMNAAHQKARAKQGLPKEHESHSSSGSSSVFSGKSTEQYFNNFSNILGNVSSKVVNEASRFFNSPSTSSDGKPAWMKEQSRYKSQNRDYEEDPGELDEETIRRLTLKENEKQRHRDLERQRERMQRDHPTRTETSSAPIPTLRPPKQPARAHSTRPSSSQQQIPPEQGNKQQEDVDLFAPLPSKSSRSREQEVDLFSSPAPPRRPTYNNDEMKTSSRRRNKPSSSIPTPQKVNQVRTANSSISSTQLEFFKDSREQGGIAFKNGDFATALTHYQTALDALPSAHPLRIIAYSNCITAYFKAGENKKVLELAELANVLIGPERGVNEDVEPGKPIKDFWIKINTKKAESLEHLEKFKEAQNVWVELIENGSATKISLDGKRRCQSNLAPPPAKHSTPKPAASESRQSASKSAPESIHMRKPQVGPRPPNSEAVKKIQESNKALEQFEQDKYKLYDQVEAKVNSWKHSKEDNLRALLSTLQNILWSSANWKPVNMSDLVIPKKVKITYLKAVAKVHPDKLSQDASSEEKLIAQSVFVVINQAWETFKQQNGIQ